MNSNNCFSDFMTDVLFFFLNDVATHLSVPGHQTAKKSAFIEVVTHFDDELILYIS